jgi:hypothetical protein
MKPPTPAHIRLFWSDSEHCMIAWDPLGLLITRVISGVMNPTKKKPNKVDIRTNSLNILILLLIILIEIFRC